MHLLGHDVVGRRRRGTGDKDAELEIEATHPGRVEENAGEEGHPDQLRSGGEEGGKEVAAQPLKGEGAADGEEGQGQGHAGGDLETALQNQRQREFEKAPGDAGQGGEDQRVEEDLAQPEGPALLLLALSVGEEKDENGEEVEEGDEKTHEDAGAGQPELAAGVEDDG